MTYSETLDYLFQQLPMYQRVGKAAYKADLSSTHQLMEMLDNPEQKFKSVHVAGTNGKGSVSHLLASVFQEAGYKTGLYTSPHLVDFRERVRINGDLIPEQEVVVFVNEHQADFESIELSFFEWTVGLAFEFFAKQQVDIAIIEVGMGGRLDSTNVITPELSVITNIGNDHSQYLGDTPAKIAMEKAGIIKPNIPVVIGRSQRDTEGVFRKVSLQREAPITFADQQFPDEIPTSQLKGTYQRENFQTAIITLERMKEQGWDISQEAKKSGFKNVVENTGLHGRWEVLETNPTVLCDVAHNVEGLTHIFDQLKSTPYHDLHLVLGFVNDKNVSEILGMLPSDAFIYLTQPDIPRAMPVDRLNMLATDLDMNFRSFPSVSLALDAAKKEAIKDDLIFVGGSTFVVADILKEKALQ